MEQKKCKSKFEDDSLESALDRSVKNAKHLRAKDAAAVMAAKMLARKIDAWDTIVDWALEDADEPKSRPKVPQNDNVSPATFLKYLDTLGLTPEKEVEQKPEQKTNKLDQMRMVNVNIKRKAI